MKIDVNKLPYKKIAIGVGIAVGVIIIYKIVNKQVIKAKISKSQKEADVKADSSGSTFNKNLPTAYERYACKENTLYRAGHKTICDKVKNNPVP